MRPDFRAYTRNAWQETVLTTVRSRFPIVGLSVFRYDRGNAPASSNTPCCHHPLTRTPDGWVQVSGLRARR